MLNPGRYKTTDHSPNTSTRKGNLMLISPFNYSFLEIKDDPKNGIDGERVMDRCVAWPFKERKAETNSASGYSARQAKFKKVISEERKPLVYVIKEFGKCFLWPSYNHA